MKSTASRSLTVALLVLSLTSTLTPANAQSAACAALYKKADAKVDAAMRDKAAATKALTVTRKQKSTDEKAITSANSALSKANSALSADPLNPAAISAVDKATKAVSVAKENAANSRIIYEATLQELSTARSAVLAAIRARSATLQTKTCR